MPDAFAYHQIIINNDGTPVDYIFREVNAAFEEMTGLTRAEVIGKRVTQVHSAIKESALDWIGVYGKVAQGGDAIRFEHYFEPAGRWYEISAYSDEPGSFVTIFCDISMHKNMETDFSSMSGRLKAIIDNSPLLISEFKPDGQYLMENKAVADLLNMEPSEIAVCSFEDFLPPETVNLFNKRINTVVSKKEPIRVDDKVTVEEKSYYYMTTLFPLCDASGRVSSIGSIAHDITDRIETENALRDSEEKHRRLFETMAQGVVYQAADGTIISANPAAEKILGLSLEQMQGKTSLDPGWKSIREDGSAFPGEEHAAMVALRTGKKVGPIIMGVYNPQKNEHVWLSVNATPLFIPGETKPYQVYATFDDITESKQAEEALKLQASERAAFDAFTNSVSHDLQAPLRRVEGFSEALLEECPDELSDLARDYLQRITQQIGAMKERTDALLKLSRVVNHVITCEEVNLSAFAMAYLEKLRYTEPYRLVETVIEPDMQARGDANLLNIVLENLLHNTWKYSADNKKGRIECGSIIKDGYTVYFVKDNGVGFDKQRADEIFDPSRKLHSETEYQGIGIGLNLIYRIITRHGGEIWAEGEAGKGASFYFTLP